MKFQIDNISFFLKEEMTTTWQFLKKKREEHYKNNSLGIDSDTNYVFILMWTIAEQESMQYHENCFTNFETFSEIKLHTCFEIQKSEC